jgi:hypothetical protein
MSNLVILASLLAIGRMMVLRFDRFTPFLFSELRAPPAV